MTNEQLETHKAIIQFALHINVAIDVYPTIMDELDRLNDLSLSTKYKDRFTAKGKLKRDIEKAYNEDRKRFKKRLVSFKKQLEEMVIKFDHMDGKFADCFQNSIDEMYALDEKILPTFVEYLKAK